MVGDGLRRADPFLEVVDLHLDVGGEFDLGDLGVVHAAGVHQAHAPGYVTDPEGEPSLVGVVLQDYAVPGTCQFENGLHLVEVEPDLGLVGRVVLESILAHGYVEHGDMCRIDCLQGKRVRVYREFHFVYQRRNDVDNTLQGIRFYLCLEHPISLQSRGQFCLQVWLHLQQR